MYMYTTCKCVTTATSSVVTGSCFARRLRSTSPSWSADLGYPAKICQDTFGSRDSRHKKKQTFLRSWDYMVPNLSHRYLIITDSHTMEWWCNHCVRISPGSKSNAEVVTPTINNCQKILPTAHRSFLWRPCESPVNLWGSSLVQLQLARREGAIEAHSLLKQALLPWSSLQEHDTRKCIYIYMYMW
jgi:hypothetical protein